MTTDIAGYAMSLRARDMHAEAELLERLQAVNAEMLAALKAVTHKFTDIPATKNYPELWQQCRAAIAKAEQVRS